MSEAHRIVNRTGEEGGWDGRGSSAGDPGFKPHFDCAANVHLRHTLLSANVP